MIRILHAADLHLDSPFAAMRPDQAADRREEQREVLTRLIRECNERECDLLLLAGDLFDSDEVYRDTTDLLCRLLAQCRARVFIAPGNHDCYTPSSVYATVNWPENVHVFQSEQVEAVRLEGVTVYGAAFTGPHATGLMRGFCAEADGNRSVMVIHGELSDRDGLYNSISVADVAGSDLDYLALGHVHEDSLRSVGGTTVGIPGCAMGRGFDETGEKGAFYVELDGSGCRVLPVSLGAKQYLRLNVDVQNDAFSEIEAAIPANAAQTICRLTLTGECQTPDLNALQRAFGGRFDTLELVDKTLPPKDVWEDCGADSLKGIFLQRMLEIYEKAEDEDRRTVALTAKLGRDLLEGREVRAE